MDITLTMIVKNEAHVIARALKSVRPYIQSFSISDTGSTDNTMEIIREELKGIPGVLTSDKWVDFATNRNLALSRATGTHCLRLDADEIFHGPLQVNEEFDGLQIRSNEGELEYWNTRIHKNDGKWKWEGEMHECLTHPDPVIARLMLPKISTPHDGARDKAGNKTQELIEFYEKCERTPRNVFYHAQTLYGAKRLEDANLVYAERAKMGGWEEEVYYSVYQAGVIRAKLGNFDSAIATLLKAYFYRPMRYEALVWACMLLRRTGQPPKAYLFSNVIPTMSQDVIFVELDAEWRLLEEHALASFHLGLIPEAKQYFEYALNHTMSDFHRDRLVRNIEKCDGFLTTVENELDEQSCEEVTT